MKVIVFQFVVLLVLGGGNCRKLGESYSQSKLYVTMEQPQVEIVEEDPQKNLGGLEGEEAIPYSSSETSPYSSSETSPYSSSETSPYSPSETSPDSSSETSPYSSSETSPYSSSETIPYSPSETSPYSSSETSPDSSETFPHSSETHLSRKNVMFGDKIRTSKEEGEEALQKHKNSTKLFQKVYKEAPYRVTSTTTSRSVSTSRTTPTKVSVRRVPPPKTTVKYPVPEVTTPKAETTTYQTSSTSSRKTVKPVRVITRTTQRPTPSVKPIHYILTVIGDEQRTTYKPTEGPTTPTELSTSAPSETTTTTPEGSTPSSEPLKTAETVEPSEPEGPKADSEPPKEPESAAITDEELIAKTEDIIEEPSTTTPGPYDHLQVVKIPPSAISDFFSPPRPAFVKSIGHYVPPNGHYKPVNFIQEPADYSLNYPHIPNSNYFNNFIQSEQPLPFSLQTIRDNPHPQIFNSGQIIKSAAEEDFSPTDSNQNRGLRPPENIPGGFLVQNFGQEDSNLFQTIPLISSQSSSRTQKINHEATPFFTKSANSAANSLPIDNSKNVFYYTQVSPGDQTPNSLIQNSNGPVSDNLIEKGSIRRARDKISPIPATSFYLETTADRLLPVPGSVIGKPIPQLVDVHYN